MGAVAADEFGARPRRQQNGVSDVVLCQPYRHCHLEVRAAAGGVGLDPTVYAGCENAVGVYGAAGRMQVITVGPVTQGDADAVLEVCRARGLVDAGLYRSEWRDA